MDELKKCPKCGLGNRPDATRCGCGWGFATGDKQQLDQSKVAANLQRHRVAYIGGLLGFSIMAIQGLVSTLNPAPDGRLLNTAPALGVDLFLFVGVVGIVFCAVQLMRVR